jgi:hypothetical protein
MQEKQLSGKGAPSLGQSLPFVPVILSKVPRHSLAVSGFATAILCFSPSLRAFPIHPDPFVHLALAENETADGNIIFAVGKDFTLTADRILELLGRGELDAEGVRRSVGAQASTTRR